MSWRMACQGKIPIAAIGSVAGTIDTDCDSPQKLSILSINGTADTRIPIAGGRSTGPYVRDTLPSIPSVLDKFRKLDACGPATTQTAGVLATTDNTCPEGREIKWLVVTGLGHEWPGARPSLPMPHNAINATDEIWKFFSDKRSL